MKTTSLAALVFADVPELASLLSRDEQAALAGISAWRRLAEPIVAEYDGDIVDRTGDELLVVFLSAVAAMQCAIHLRLAARAVMPGSLPRIGVHLGEIWRDAGHVYGNGVNVAARVMAESAAGRIVISEDVERQVSGKLDLTVLAMPARGLKNIERPLVLYEIDPPGAPAGAGRIDPSPQAAPLSKATQPVAVPPASPPPAGGRKFVDVEHSYIHTSGNGRGITIDLGSGSEPRVVIHKGRSGKKKRSASVRPLHAELREKAAKGMASGFTTLLWGGAVGGAVLWWGLAMDSTFLLAASGLCGFLPAVIGLGKIVGSALDHRDAKRDENRER